MSAIRLFATSLVLMLVVACSGGIGGSDVRFSLEMVPQYRQTVQLAEMAQGRAYSDWVKATAVEIKSQGRADLQAMGNWLSTWEVAPPPRRPPHRAGEHHRRGVRQAARPHGRGLRPDLVRADVTPFGRRVGDGPGGSGGGRPLAYGRSCPPPGPRSGGDGRGDRASTGLGLGVSRHPGGRGP